MRISDWSSDVCSSDLGIRARIYRLDDDFTAAAVEQSQLVRSCIRQVDQAVVVKRPAIIDADNDRTAIFGISDARVADRKSAVSGQGVSVRVDLGGRRSIKKKSRIIIEYKNRSR